MTARTRLRPRRVAVALALVALGSCQVTRRPAPESVEALRVAGVRRLTDRVAQSPAAWAPDGGAVLYAADGALWTASLAGGERRVASVGVVTAVAWSAASRWIAYIDRGRVFVAQPGGAPRALRVEGFATALDWDRGGTRLAVVTVRVGATPPRSDLSIVSASGAYVRALASAREIHDVRWFADGLYVFYGEGDGGITRLWKRRVRGPDARSLPSPLSGLRRALLSPTGRDVALLAGGGRQAALYVARPDGTGLREIGAAGSLGGVSWSPQGDKVAYVRFLEEAIVEVWVADAVGGGDRRVTEYQVEFPDPGLDLVTAWSPDGRRLLYGTNTGSFSGPLWLATFVPR